MGIFRRLFSRTPAPPARPKPHPTPAEGAPRICTDCGNWQQYAGEPGWESREAAGEVLWYCRSCWRPLIEKQPELGRPKPVHFAPEPGCRQIPLLRELRIPKGQDAEVKALSFCGDRIAVVISGGMAGPERLEPTRLVVWCPNAEKPDRDHTFPHGCAHLAAFSPDGSVLGFHFTHRRWTDDDPFEEYLRIMRVDGSGDLLMEPGSCPSELAVSPDGWVLACATHRPERGSILALRDRSGRLPSTLEVDHSSPLGSLKFSPSGAQLAGVFGDKRIQVWRLTDLVITHQPYEAAWSVEPVVLGFAPGNDLLFAFSTAEELAVWRQTEHAQPTCVLRIPGRATPRGFSTDGKLFAAVGPGGAWVWRLASEKPLGALECGDKGLDLVTFSPSGMMLAAVCHDGMLRVWLIPR